ncbi:mannitol dehydrogenase family protein [Winkia neuii]|uniref:Mannitol-1-phosphate 5-dehydrogenase n=1 Tax=Winkia neuii subsp. anitrata TaxID=29318 RepID=A0AB38XNI0_9ACTO|nr:mannitol dehydrogenase family protein [Winkia neuii]WCE45902.1 mannitol dehydrogenase family protein [Winkia neuii subsp. anitrata]
MKLADSNLAPTYDRSELTCGIVHFGVDNFHRSHQAMFLDRLLREGKAKDWAICGVGVMPGDKKMRDALAGQDHLYTLVLKNPDGTKEPAVIGSIIDYLFAPDDPNAVVERMSSEDTKIVSLTVTEGGYNIDDETGKFRTDAKGAVHDAEHPEEPQTTFGFIVAALRRRKEAGLAPFTVMSCDNLPGNGNIARTAVVEQARLADPEFAEWIDQNVSFPNCMVDRITPVTTDADRQMVKDELDLDDAWPVVAEPFVQWVLEDKFPLGRPAYEEVGAQLVDDVVPYELMKLRLLNAAHQSLAHWGRLLGLTYGHDSARDEDIAGVTRRYLEQEARPTLRPVPGIDLDAYIDELFERFGNEAIADTLARLAQDASDRMPKFVLPSVRQNLKDGGQTKIGAAMCAAWALGCEGKAEDGTEVVIDDQHGKELAEAAKKQAAGDDTAFIADQFVFGELAQNEQFKTEFVQALHDLREKGAREVMRSL